MRSLKYAHDVISILELGGVGSIHRSGTSFIIPRTDKTTLVSISESSVGINGTNFNDRITPAKRSELDSRVDIDSFKFFIRELSRLSKVTLNHFGISYYCDDLEAEVEHLKQLVGNEDLYEEASGTISTKWLFIGNAKDHNERLFELVLNKTSKPVTSSWVPHFQIDIDTTLTLEDLKRLIKSHLGDDWIKWSLTVEDWGVPLVMGKLCNIDGLKVYLGIGTNKRSREWHRSEGLQRL